MGAGLAGVRAAERLRELEFGGEIVVVGAEHTRPYHRPSLSKQLLQGAIGVNDVKVTINDSLDVVWRLGETVTRLQPLERVVHLPGGEEIRYDGLVIATGVEPRRLSDGQHGHPRVTCVRRVSDTMTIRESIATSRGPVVVIGNGFTGCEIASTLRTMNCEVILVVRGRDLMGKVLGSELGSRLVDLHRAHGVDVALDTVVERWKLTEDAVKLTLSDGRTILAAAVVVAIGSKPNVDWLRDSGLPVKDGVLCGPTCHVEGFDDIVAAGDVAQWPNLRYDTVPRRLEHWINAMEMGRAAADSLMFGRSSAPPFMPLPRFWSIQHGVRIQAAGIPALGTDQVTLWESRGGSQSVTGYVRNGRTVGMVGVNCPSSFLLAVEEELVLPQRELLSEGVERLYREARFAGQPEQKQITG